MIAVVGKHVDGTMDISGAYLLPQKSEDACPAMSSTENVLELGHVTHVLWSLNYANVAVTAFWSYDYVLTLADEVAFLKQSQWKWAKLLYVVCRYITCCYLTLEMLVAFQPMMSIHICQVIYSVNTYLGGFIVVCAEGVFLFRVCAIWGFRRSIVVLFSISGLMYVIAATVVLSIIRSPPTITKSPIPVTSCLETGNDKTIIILYVILIALEIQIWVFALYKVAASYRRGGDRNRLLEQLIRHNMLYLTCGIVFSLGVILTTALLKVSYGFMVVRFLRNWQVTVHAFLVTKMYRGLWRADRRRALLESVSFSLEPFHAAPGVSSQA
ncbi:hypothetical protein DEU56DRAFT_69008 [Suillus clintonianus]|uniref:uncharacterized protein n=1 Tax=Suillus clintonianus TaxID=1904413 RepID=UPI001B86E8A8|nr:uncharacterized protein DEU56DRAFT_69008 [Suillus clintonianus]KAG2122763.1 hypothetical protein DEU56DRAFT_69008 [Suillus clintonianus]